MNLADGQAVQATKSARFFRTRCETFEQRWGGSVPISEWFTTSGRTQGEDLLAASQRFASVRANFNVLAEGRSVKSPHTVSIKFSQVSG